LVLTVRVELTTYCLQNSYSTNLSISVYLILFAGILGIRPRLTISKTVVLSLHHIPAKKTKLNTIIYYLVVLEKLEFSPKDFQSFMLTTTPQNHYFYSYNLLCRDTWNQTKAKRFKIFDAISTSYPSKANYLYYYNIYYWC
jgi:hypothetical protein